MTKVHLTHSIEPISPRTAKVLALCAHVIPNPVFEFSWSPGEEMEESVSTLQFCQKCLSEVPMIRNIGHFYIYGVISGEEAKQEEAAA